MFTPDDVEIVDISTGNVIALGIANHDLNIYEFSNFFLYSTPNALLTHENEVSGLF